MNNNLNLGVRRFGTDDLAARLQVRKGSAMKPWRIPLAVWRIWQNAYSA